MKYRIGIYAGTFDPVHAGHIAFALQALEHAELDKVYFLPERCPRDKKGVEHFGHRVAMLRWAAAPHPKLNILELEDINFSVPRTLPKLRKRFGGQQLVFLFGSDAIKRLPTWPSVGKLLTGNELVIGIRNDGKHHELREMIGSWPHQPKAVTMFDSHIPYASSSKIREGLRRRQPVQGVLSSVERYSNHNWLYVSVG